MWCVGILCGIFIWSCGFFAARLVETIYPRNLSINRQSSATSQTIKNPSKQTTENVLRKPIEYQRTAYSAFVQIYVQRFLHAYSRSLVRAALSLSLPNSLRPTNLVPSQQTIKTQDVFIRLLTEHLFHTFADRQRSNKLALSARKRHWTDFY